MQQYGFTFSGRNLLRSRVSTRLKNILICALMLALLSNGLFSSISPAWSLYDYEGSLTGRDVFQMDVAEYRGFEYSPGVLLVGLKSGIELGQTDHIGSNRDNPLFTNSSRLQADMQDLFIFAAEPVFFNPAGGELRADSTALAGNQNGAALENIYKLRFPPQIDIEHAIQKLSKNPDIEFVEPDYIARPAYVPDDPLYPGQWAMNSIGVEAAWEVITGTATTVIAVIDSGVDLAHPEFAGRLWSNPGEIPSNGQDDDNNGFVDDTHGWDFVYGSNNLSDENGHGTEVAGVALATGDNSAGMAGVCWGCRLMPVKVIQPSGIANYSDVAAGIIYAANKGARIINLSLGGYADSSALRAAIQAAASKAVIVAAAGNDSLNEPFYPAAYAPVLAVAATTELGTKTSFSNYGDWVDVSAPGAEILTTFAGGGWGTTSGTSLAAPFVSGLAGLLYSQHPEWSAAMIRAHIIETATNLSSSEPVYASLLGAGLIDAASAMQAPRPDLAIESFAVNGELGGLVTPGSQANTLVIQLNNRWAEARDVTGTLSTPETSVTLGQPEGVFGDIATGKSAPGSTFLFDLSPVAGYDTPLRFDLQVTANQMTYTATLPITLTTSSAILPVSGAISTSTSWSKDRIYLITNDLTVNPGITLTIEAGTEVRFGGNYSLDVYGSLIADGRADQPIVFTTGSDSRWDSIIFQNSSPDARSDVNGNYISGSILRHVIIEASTGGVRCSGATPYLANITSATAGILCAPGETPLWTIENTLSGGIYITLGTAYIERNTLSGKGLHATGQAFVRQNSVTGASLSIGSGLLAENTVNGGSLGLGSNSTATNNTVTGGGISAGNTVTVTANTVTGGGISVGASSQVISNTVQNAPYTGITTGNNVTARGNRLVGNGQGMVATTGLIEHNLFANNRGHGLQAGAATIIHNSFTGNRGDALRVLGQNPLKIQYNNFEANLGAYDLYVALPWNQYMYVPATFNWWGTTDAEAIAGRIYDFNDDSTKAKVTFINWLANPDEQSPAYVRNLTISPDDVLGIQTGSFQVTYSRPMDTLISPQLSFFTARRGEWGQHTPDDSGLPGAVVSAVTPDLYADPWFGTQTGGAAHFDGDTWQIYNQSNSGLPTDAINAIAVDMDGSTWFGTDQGVAHLSGGNWQVYTATSTALPGNLINAIAIDFDRAKWFGTSEGLAWFDGATWITYTLANSGLPSNWINAIAQDADRTMWFGTDSGVAHFDGLSWRAYNSTNTNLPGNLVQAIAVDGNGVKWIGTGQGLARYDGETWTVYTSTLYLPAPDVRAIAVDPNDVKWFATASGLASFDGEQWETYTSATSGLPADDILAITANERGVKWLGFNGAGAGVLYDSPDYAISDSPTWLDAYNYQAAYNITALVARDIYSITVGSALGSDLVWSAPNQAYTFTVDYASFVADDTPPPPPAVDASSDGGLETISFRASSSDSDSAITAYGYAIGTTPGGQEVVSWTSLAGGSLASTQGAGVATTIFTRTGLSLLAGETYYVSVQARNAGGLWSPVGISNPLIAGQITNPIRTIYLPHLNR